MAGFVLCGEGPTDLFYDEVYQKQGPIKDSVDQLLLHFWGAESAFEFERMSPRNLKVSAGKGKPEKKSAIVRGAKNRFPEHRNIAVRAKCLAEKAETLASEKKEDPSNWGVIYFHDLDSPSGTDIDSTYVDYIAAMHEGFDAAKYERGVPMVPKTRSESWLLCVMNPDKCKENKYYENLAMSDKSPKAGKKVLSQEQGKSSKRDAYKCLEKQRDDFDWVSLESPSFVFFRNRLHVVSAALLHETFPEGMNLANTKMPV